MDSPDKSQPLLKETLTVQKCASIFRNILATTLSEESPFADAFFVTAIAEQYLDDKNQAGYFTSEGGFGSNIIISDGVARPNIDLNIQIGLESRHLPRRVALRLGKEKATDEEIFQFAVGHELGHLIQGLADPILMEDQNLNALTEKQINKLKKDVEDYNKNIETNQDIRSAQDYFRSIFGADISREPNEAYIDTGNYTNEEYLKYVNSSAEANADFVSLWIIGMQYPDMKTSPQNEGYDLKDWSKWAADHKIVDNLLG